MGGQIMTLGSDDTIELVLTPEQMLGLSQAAEAAEIAASEPADVTPIGAIVVIPRALPPITRRWHQTPLAKMAANTIAFVAFAWWSVAQLSGEPEPHPQARIAAVKPAAIVHQVAVVSAPAKPAVQVINPFDKSEVFEFPPGTSNEEGRQKVAQILMQRARERLNHWERSKSDATLRTASLAPVRRSIGPRT